VQIENKDHATTYCDGDQVGAVVGRTDFYWLGTPHASQSSRSDQCGIGGRMYSFKELGFRILSIFGLGLAGLQPRLQPLVKGGAFYQDTIITDRQFSIVGQVDGINLQEVQRKRQAFVELLRPDTVTPSQPVSLRWIPTDNCGEQIGDELEILCVPDGDVLPMQLDNRHAERFSLPFRLYLPFVARDDGEVGAVLDYQDALASSVLFKRSPAGLWSVPGGGSPITATTVYDVLPLPDGTVAVGGNFLNAGGDANADHLAKYTPSTDTFSSFNATPLDFAVQALAILADGNTVALGGAFNNAGGDANADRLAKLLLSTGAYSSFNATPLNANVDNLLALPNGTLAIAGSFTNAGGDGNADYLAKMSAAFAFSAFVASALSDRVQGLAFGKDGNLIIVGRFANAGADVDADGIAKVILATSAFAPIVDGVSIGVGPIIVTADVAPDGTVYFGGNFTNGAGIAELDYGGAVKGNAYIALSTGFDTVVTKILVLRDGSVLFAGNFVRAGTLTVSRIALWNGSTFVYADFIPTQNIQTLRVAADGTLYIGVEAGGTATGAGVTTITNSGSAKSYPRIKLTGPGTLYQLKNYTTGRALYFNLVLLAGETAVLDFSNPQNTTFVSNFRGDLLSTILRGSTFDFFLAPGQNSISLFIAGTTDGNTAAGMSWRETFHSIDGAIPAHALP